MGLGDGVLTRDLICLALACGISVYWRYGNENVLLSHLSPMISLILINTANILLLPQYPVVVNIPHPCRDDISILDHIRVRKTVTLFRTSIPQRRIVIFQVIKMHNTF